MHAKITLCVIVIRRNIVRVLNLSLTVSLRIQIIKKDTAKYSKPYTIVIKLTFDYICFICLSIMPRDYRTREIT